MMREPLTPALVQLLQRQLQAPSAESDALEVLDLVPLPRTSDRMVRFRNLQELLDEFGTSDESVYSYVIHVRKKAVPMAAASPSESCPSGALPASSVAVKHEEIYLADGSLNGDYLLQNADLLFAAGEFSSARQIFHTLRKYSSHTSEAMLGLARCLESEGNAESAVRAYEEAVLYHPQLETYQRFAALLIRLKKDQTAAEILERAVLLRELAEPVRFEMHKAAGNCYLRAELFPKAERHYQRALEIRADSDLIATSLGALNLQMARPERAVDCFRKALTLNAKNEQALTGIATAELTLGRKSEALEAFVRSLTVNLQQPKAIFQVVKLAYELKNYASAAKILQAYIEVSPFNANLHYSLAGLEFHLGQFATARERVVQILQVNPNHEEARKLRERIGDRE